MIVTTFVSACIAFAPQEWVSAITLMVAAAAMAVYDRRLVMRERTANPPPVSPPSPSAST